MSRRSTLLESIANIIKDYRVGEVATPTPEHVNRWINQFVIDVQLPILIEMEYVLKNTYISKPEVESFLSDLIHNEKLAGLNPCLFWQNVNFLNIQGAGNSQREMLEMFNTVLKKECDLCINECGNMSDTFLYLDDAIFTGNRVLNDLSCWIKEHAPQKATVHVVNIAFHRLGQWYASNKIQKAIDDVDKEIDIHWWRCMEIEDRKSYTNESDVLRPVSLPNDLLVEQYVHSLRYEQTFRTPGSIGYNSFYSSECGRHLLEQEFLKAGVKIRAMCPYLNVYQRPLGNMVLESLGFGSLLVTFRNCPNNSPLALWAGDPWYPLFPRKVN